ncbi:TPA: hypothetical protein DCZ15_02510 [Candidatus Falkowbacteria bacterium]|nr:MAG: hypothetical protein UV95_C0001G0105 [Candidatus Falkowbacteria bacterium GW2011_GWF2_43_32]HBA36727.1 hypothetical protein [Candidatus Falkowbacteria bacterium]
MKFSLIIINYKTPDLTADCLRGIFLWLSREEAEIILIDNASRDGSREKLQAEFGSQIKIIANEHNLGFAAANNQGAAVARGDYLLFLNSDTVIKENFWNTCARLLEDNKDIGLISPRLRLPSGEYQQAAFGKFPTLWRLLAQTTKKDQVISGGTDFYVSDWISGCALMIKKNVFQELDGWDDNFFLYYEDVDLCRRAYQKGYKSAVALNTNVIHLGGQSLTADPEKKKRYYASQDYYFQKHYSFLVGLIVKIARFFYSNLKV